MSRTRLLALLGTVLWIALVIAVFGFLSLLLDLEVMPDPDAGPLLAPAMIVGAGLVLTAVLMRIQRRDRGVFAGVVGAAVVTWIAFLVVGGIGYALASGDPAQVLFFPLRYGISPFAVAAGLLGGVVALGVIGASARDADGGRPRWPWEDRDAP